MQRDANVTSGKGQHCSHSLTQATAFTNGGSVRRSATIRGVATNCGISKEWSARDHYRSFSRQLDMRFRRDHNYPRRGNVLNILPPGYFDIPYRGSRYYFQGGVWFRGEGLNFIVTLPPVGTVVPLLPPD
ncbi:MAG: DUF6515 family protein [Gallionellaceae bacterium]